MESNLEGPEVVGVHDARRVLRAGSGPTGLCGARSGMRRAAAPAWLARTARLGALHGSHGIDGSGVHLGVRLFAADGVTWVIEMPSGLANDTIWPGMEWIEALAPVPVEAEAQAEPEAPEEVAA